MDVQLKDDEKKPWWYFILGTALYFSAMYPICNAMQNFQSYEWNTHSELFNTLYYRYYVNTETLGAPQFVYYLLSLPIAFTFINVVNLQYERGNPFKGAQGNYRSFHQTIFFAAVFFFVSGMVTLRQKDDLQMYCNLPANVTQTNYTQLSEQLVFNLDAGEQLVHPLAKLMYTIDKMNYLNGPYHPKCQEFSQDQILGFNYWVWTLAFYIGLQFTHLDTGILQDLTLDWEVMKNWPWYMWVIFLGMITLLVTILSYVFYLYYTIGYLRLYLLILAGIVGYFVIMSKVYAGKYRIHFHHYFLGMCGVTIMCYQNGFVVTVNAIFTGIMIEGGCRWGYSSMWVRESSELSERAQQSVQKFKQSTVREDNHKKGQIQAAFVPQINENNSFLINPFLSQDNLSCPPSHNYTLIPQQISQQIKTEPTIVPVKKASFAPKIDDSVFVNVSGCMNQPAMLV